MSEARSFINARAQTYESLKAGISMSANQRAKFDVLNAHIVNSVVVGGSWSSLEIPVLRHAPVMKPFDGQGFDHSSRYCIQ